MDQYAHFEVHEHRPSGPGQRKTPSKTIKGNNRAAQKSGYCIALHAPNCATGGFDGRGDARRINTQNRRKDVKEGGLRQKKGASRNEGNTVGNGRGHINQDEATHQRTPPVCLHQQRQATPPTPPASPGDGGQAKLDTLPLQWSHTGHTNARACPSRSLSGSCSCGRAWNKSARFGYGLELTPIAVIRLYVLCSLVFFSKRSWLRLLMELLLTWMRQSSYHTAHRRGKAYYYNECHRMRSAGFAFTTDLMFYVCR